MGIGNVITYLNVPYRENEEAKAAGARWSFEKRLWYVEGDVSAVIRWLPAQKIHPHMVAPHKATQYEKERRENVAAFRADQELRRIEQMKEVNARKAAKRANRRKAQEAALSKNNKKGKSK